MVLYCSRRRTNKATSNGEAVATHGRDRKRKPKQDEITDPMYADIVKVMEQPPRLSDQNTEINAGNDQIGLHASQTGVIYSELQALGD